MSMHVCKHVCVCVCVSMHNPIQMNDKFVFFFIQFNKGREGHQEFPYSGEDLSLPMSLNL